MADNSHFFAHLARMKLIHRWPLMHNVRIENVQEHSLQVAMVAHALALLREDAGIPPGERATPHFAFPRVRSRALVGEPKYHPYDLRARPCSLLREIYVGYFRGYC